MKASDEVWCTDITTIPELTALVEDWMEFYNHRRRHQALSNSTPWSVYQEAQMKAA